MIPVVPINDFIPANIIGFLRRFGKIRCGQSRPGAPYRVPRDLAMRLYLCSNHISKGRVVMDDQHGAIQFRQFVAPKLGEQAVMVSRLVPTSCEISSWVMARRTRTDRG